MAKSKSIKEPEKIQLGPMPDANGYRNRIGIKSESSNRIYVVAERISDGVICCSCMAGKSRKSCKHIDDRKGVKKANKFLDGYKTYEGPRGSSEEWRKAFGEGEDKESSSVVLETGRKFKHIDIKTNEE